MLSEDGFRNLLELHFRAVSHELLYVLNIAIFEAEKSNNTYDMDLLNINSRRVIDLARNRLLPFRTQKIENIPKFLDRHFSPENLAENKRGGRYT